MELTQMLELVENDVFIKLDRKMEDIKRPKSKL